MDVFEISKYPENVLRKKCQPIERVTERERTLFQQMLYTMRHFKGIGLAAPQIGIAKQIIVADIGEGAVALANPKIVNKKGMDVLTEGCLSIPEVQVEISRHYEIILTGLNERGEMQEIKTKDLMARVLQHEIDHLNGKLIIDYFPLWERISFKRKRGRYGSGVLLSENAGGNNHQRGL